jgi:flagellar basal-body rod modification protein FlgD
MAVDATMPTTVVSTPASTSSTSQTTTASTATPGIADNFQTFLTLLTTQLQNQNPLDPLDTNQFTAQLVQFAGVEQQLKSNDQLKSLIDLQKSAQATAALAYVGNTVAVDGSTGQLNNGSATWNLKTDTAANATVTITSSNGQTAYSGTYNLNQGSTSFVWDGKGNDGTQWPAGAYKLTTTAKDTSGNTIAIATETQGVVDSVDLTATPALLSIGGQNYTTDQIKRVMRTASASSG